MSDYSEFYNVIDDITEHLRTDFIGPSEADEVLEIEEPLNRYSLGILYSQPNNKCSETDADSPAEELFEEILENTEEPKNMNVFKPSTMGISFATQFQDKLSISFSYAMYIHSEQVITDNGEEVKHRYYSRKAKNFSEDVIVPDKVCIITDKSNPDITVYLHVRKINDDNSRLVTVSVLNNHMGKNGFIENNTGALFQCELSVKSKKGFLPVYRKNTHGTSEDEKNDMLYDSVNNYSYGHGCSSVHLEEKDIVNEVRSEFIPQFRLLQMMPRLLADSEYLNMMYWENVNRNTACQQLDNFIKQYENWYIKLKDNTDLIAKYPETAENSFENIERCITRLRNGVEILRTNDSAWKAFVYMNEAMLLQRIKTKHCPPDKVSWYPFQMAYILQIIPDIVDNNSPFHKDVDLLWFPTGGGKTEAYLGLSAFSIFFRRLDGKNQDINGVTVIMRYTLRLLCNSLKGQQLLYVPVSICVGSTIYQVMKYLSAYG